MCRYRLTGDHFVAQIEEVGTALHLGARVGEAKLGEELPRSVALCGRSGLGSAHCHPKGAPFPRG